MHLENSIFISDVKRGGKQNKKKKQEKDEVILHKVLTVHNILQQMELG
jgi:hypothetical protein